MGRGMMKILKSDKVKSVKIEETRDGMFLGLKSSEHANWISYPVTEKHLWLLQGAISEYFDAPVTLSAPPDTGEERDY